VGSGPGGPVRQGNPQLLHPGAPLGGHDGGCLVEPADLGSDRGELLQGDEIALVDQDDVGLLELHPADIADLGISDAGVAVDDADDAVEAGSREFLFHLVDQSVRFGHAGRFQDDQVGLVPVDQLVHRGNELPGQLAADAAAC